MSQELEILMNNMISDGIKKIDCKNGPLVLGERTLVMGILNITPDFPTGKI